jgi:hypothetical protein
MWKGESIAVVAFGAFAAMTGCGETEPSTIRKEDRVNGHLEGCGEACSDTGLFAALHGSDVYCYWDGDHVKVHLALENSFAARIEFSIAPVYIVKRGGKQGDELGADRAVTLDGGESTDVTIDAGTPLGVAEGAPIEECVPELDRALVLH